MSSCIYSLIFVCKADRWSTLHSVWYEVYRCHTSAPNLWCKIDLFLSQSQSPNDCWPTKLPMLFLKNETHHNESKYCFVKSHKSSYSSLKIHHASGTQLLRLTHIYIYIYIYIYINKGKRTNKLFLEMPQIFSPAAFLGRRVGGYDWYCFCIHTTNLHCNVMQSGTKLVDRIYALS